MKPEPAIGQVWKFHYVGHNQSFPYLITNVSLNHLGLAYVTIESVGAPPPGWSRGLSGMSVSEFFSSPWTYEGTHSTIEEIML